MTRILKYVPIIGKQYRDWTVISDQIYKKDSNRATYWKVRCKCGKEEDKCGFHANHKKNILQKIY